MLGLGSGTPAATSGPLEDLSSSLAGEAVRRAAHHRQPYDDSNTWLRGSGGSRALVEGEGCAPVLGKVLRPTSCQELAGEYSFLVDSKELPLLPPLFMCFKSSSFTKQ